MQAVRRPKTRPDAYLLAHEAFLRAEFDVADLYLGVVEPATAAERGRTALLRARLARFRGDAAAWLAHAERAREEHPSAVGRLKALAMSAAASRRLGDGAAADRAFAAVRAELRKAATPELAWAAYLVALDAWERHDYEDSEGVLEPFLALDVPSPHHLALKGWIAVKRERYREAGRQYAAAIASPEAGEDGGTLMHANAVSSALTIGVETADVKLLKRARRAYDAIAWTDSIAWIRSMCAMNLRWSAMLEGDLDAAWIVTRDSIAYAPTRAYEIIAEASFATLCRQCGDFELARRQFRIAWTHIREHRWSEADEDERVALSSFAAEAAHDMPAEARKALTMYLSLRAKRVAHHALDGDPRVDAYTAMTIGRIEEATGSRARAIGHYRDALALYERLGLNLRVAIVSADLYRLTRDETLRSAIVEATKGAPKAWLRPTSSPADALGPKGREILARLLLGESAKMIAAELGRSAYTVSNHTRRIFEVFEVHSRDDLRETCRRLEITPMGLRQK